jgi:hypothetical protein
MPAIAIIFAIILIVFVINKKKKLVAEAPAADLKEPLSQHIEFYNNLSDADKPIFEQKVAGLFRCRTY